jgi:hypothetical protein
MARLMPSAHALDLAQNASLFLVGGQGRLTGSLKN